MFKKSQNAVCHRNADKVRIDSEPRHSSRPAFAAGVVNARDKITKCQRLLLMIGFHDIHVNWETGAQQRKEIGSPGRARTYNLVINSHSLHH